MEQYHNVPSQENALENDKETEDPRDEQCGLLNCRPRWLRKFANSYMYAAVYGMGNITHGMLFTYFISVFTTIEKRFSISSSMTGLILASNDFTQVLSGLVITYFGARGSPPFVMSTGCYIMAVSCIMMASAELFPMSGEGLTLAQRTGGQELCVSNASYVGRTECLTDSSYSGSAVILLIIAQGLYGIGSSSIYSLGMTYLDDSIPKARVPLFVGAITCLRMIGPLIGYVLGAVCLTTYRNPTENPGYDNKDPRWIGAWWIGFIIVGLLSIAQGFFLSLFPRRLPVAHEVQSEKVPETKKSLKDFIQVMKRVGRNKIVICYALAGVFYLIGVVGFSTFQPKYLESQFKQSASAASYFAGLTGLPVVIVGLAVGGIILWVTKPRALCITSWGVFTAIVFVLTMGLIMNMYCDTSVNYTNSYFENGNVYSNSSCVADCNCGLDKPSPVCIEGYEYMSPCYAGCTNVANHTAPGNQPIFANCSCAVIPYTINNTTIYNTTTVEEESWPEALKGYCSASCSFFIPYIAIMAVEKFIGATSRVGEILIPLRIVDKEDKSMVMSLVVTVLDLLAFIVTPIIYGAAVDSTCVLWENKCGRRGNCWVYDVDKLRYMLHGMTILFGSIGVFFEICVAYFTRNMSFFDDKHPSTVQFSASDGTASVN